MVQSATVSCTDAIKKAWTTDALNWLSLSQHTTPAWTWHGWHWNSWRMHRDKRRNGFSMIFSSTRLPTTPLQVTSVRFSISLPCSALTYFDMLKLEQVRNDCTSRATRHFRWSKYENLWYAVNQEFCSRAMSCSSVTKMLATMDHKWPMLRGWNGTHLQTCSCHCLGSRSKRLTSSWHHHDIMVKVPGIQESECWRWNQFGHCFPILFGLVACGTMIDK